MSEATCGMEYTTEASLYLAFELSKEKWKLGFSTGLGQPARRRTIDAGDLLALEQEIEEAKKRFHLPTDTPVKSCYEAGRDGFWIHRYLQEVGIENLVVDSSSINIDRRAKRAKTDWIDVEKLLNMLMRYYNGEQKVWSVVQVPSVEVEDKRHLHRQLCRYKGDRIRYIGRIKGLLATQGLNLPIHVDFLDKLETARSWDGSRLPPGLHARVEREYTSLRYIEKHIQELETERDELIETLDDPSVAKVRQLMKLRAIGPNSAWLFVMEFFGWREFRNRREVGGLAGLSPTPYQSGGEWREQGISKAGNCDVRAVAIEIAWCWLGYQPDSELAIWFRDKFGHSKRTCKIGIVALARKLLIALWRYLEMGEVPAGACLKP